MRGLRQGRAERLGGLADRLQLLGLIVRHEALDGHDPRDLGQLAHALRILLGDRKRRRQHLDGAGAGRRIAAQLQIGGDRLHLGAVQVDRVEVELQIVKERQAAQHHHGGADDDADAVPLHEAIDRRQRLVAERLLLAGRVEHLEQRMVLPEAHAEGDDQRGQTHD